MKVKLSKEVADAIDELRKDKWSNKEIVTNIYSSCMEEPIIVITGFSELYGFDTLLQALVNGYEVIEEPQVITITPEQKQYVLRFHQELQDADCFTEGERARHLRILHHTLFSIGIEWEELQ